MDRRTLLFVISLTVALFFVNQWFGDKGQEKKQALVEEVKTEAASLPQAATPLPAQVSKEEQFYVLQNQFQQLVFSTVGGSLAELNLPIAQDEHPQSAVRAIGFDRTLQESYAYNDYFPAFPYHIIEGSKAVMKTAQTPGGYYPLLRRTVKGRTGAIAHALPPHLYGLTIQAEDGSLENQIYRVTRFEKNLIEFQLEQPQRRIVKTFSFPDNTSDAPYCVDVAIRIEGDARNIMINTGLPEVELISGNAAPTLKYRMMTSNPKKVQVGSVSLPKSGYTANSAAANWISNSNGFFGLILDPLTEIPPGFRTYLVPGTDAPTRLTLIDAQYQLYPAEKYPAYDMTMPLSAKTTHFRLYAGPYEDDLLAQVDQTYFDGAKGYNPSYIGAMSFQGWFTFISEPFAKFLFVLMQFFYKITSSWGISIMLLTLALRIMLYPLNAWSIKSTLKMQQVAPKVAQIQEKYKKDPKRAQMEVMNLYREKGVNPLTGCFPLLIQLPFLIGMFDLLKSTFELRGASFIPGWIDNLTAPDVLFSWNYPIVFFGTDFHLLPFLLGGVMWLQQRFSATAPKDPKLMTDQQKQQKFMGNIMTIVFTVMFYHFPSGLNLYWLSSMGLGIVQQWVMTKKMLGNKVET
jgi:YidC/Oxa1 family membrane protein insertase